MFVATRMVIVTKQVKFAVDAKRAFEQKGEFVVNTFNEAQSALDYVRQNPQAIALLDFRVTDVAGPELIDLLRSMQPDIALVVGPDHPAVRQMQEKYKIQAVVDLPTPLRKLEAIIKDAVREMFDAQPSTRPGDAVQEAPPSLNVMQNYSQTIDFWVTDIGDNRLKLESTGAATRWPQVEEPTASEPATVFDRLLSEEPPLPDEDDGSTIADFSRSLLGGEHESQTPQQMLVPEDQGVTQPSPEFDEPASSSSLPRLVLEEALGESTPFSLDAFQERVERIKPGIQALPSWVDEREQYVREPDFLPPELPQFTGPLEFTSPTTISRGSDDTDLDAAQWRTETMETFPQVPPSDDRDAVVEPGFHEEDTAQEAVARPVPPPPPGFEGIKPPPGEQPTIAEAPQNTPALRDDAQTTQAEVESTAEIEPLPMFQLPRDMPHMPFTDVHESDQQVIQMATILTQTALELTAETCLITRNGQVLAYAGKLPPEEIEEIRHQIGGDWDTVESKSRIRFLRLPESGQDYMLFSRQTQQGFTLSMVFAGTMPIRNIRRQAQRLTDALVNMPETVNEGLSLSPDTSQAMRPVQAAQPAPAASPDDDVVVVPEDGAEEDASEEMAVADIGARAPMSFVWLLRNTNHPLEVGARHAMRKSLKKQLATAGWIVEELEISPDAAYLYAQVPAEQAPHRLLRFLLQFSTIAVTFYDPDRPSSKLWVDSYLVLQPGRSLSQEEIERFLRFARK